VRVDGNDVLALYKVLTDAIARARSGQGPRSSKRSRTAWAPTRRATIRSSTAPTARSRRGAKKDPIDRLRRYLDARGLMDDAKDAKLEADASAEIVSVINK